MLYNLDPNITRDNEGFRDLYSVFNIIGTVTLGDLPAYCFRNKNNYTVCVYHRAFLRKNI